MGVTKKTKLPRPLIVYEAVSYKIREFNIGCGNVVVFSSKSPVEESVNEDSLLVKSCGDGRAVIAVADGVGGSKSGNVASRLALEILDQAIDEVLGKFLELRTGIINGIERANREVIALRVGAATTLIAIEISLREVQSFHVGDSFSLLVGQKGKVKMKTVDHSSVGYGVESGLIDPEQAMVHEQRNIIINFVGSEDMKIEIGPRIKFAKRDTVIIGSDGLSDNLSASEIINITRAGSLETSAEELVKLAQGRMLNSESGSVGKPDDLTFALFRPHNR